ncbi:MAG: hypothetical protein ACK6BQ_10820 [Bacteroidota bacterium]
MKAIVDTPKGENITMKPTNTITIDYLLDVLVSWYNQILKNKFTFLLFFVIGGAVGFSYAHFLKKVQYLSRLTFVIDRPAVNTEEEHLLHYSGVNTTGNPSSKLLNGDNLRIILQSDKIIKEALLSPIIALKGRNLLFLLGMENLIPLSANSKDSLTNMTIKKLKKSHLLVGKLEEMGSMYFIEMHHDQPLFCYYFPEKLLESLLKFYETEKSLELERYITTLRRQWVNIKDEIKNAQMVWYAKKNRSRNLVFFEDQFLLEKLEKNIEEAQLKLKINEEILDIAVYQQLRKSSFIHLIDTPVLPLEFKGKKRWKHAFIIGFLFLLIPFNLYLKTSKK